MQPSLPPLCLTASLVSAAKIGGFLPTLMCEVISSAQGTDAVTARLVIDTGSEHSFITKKLARSASLLHQERSTQALRGIGGAVVAVKQSYCQVTLRSLVSTKEWTIYVRCIPEVCGHVPGEDITEEDLSGLGQLALTEKYPRRSGAIDILIGQDLLSQLMLPELKKDDSGIMAWSTIMGTAVSGRRKAQDDLAKHLCCINDNVSPTLTNHALGKLLTRFWDLETLGIKDQREILQSPDEKYAVQHFAKHTVQKDNRYCVSLPFKPEATTPLNNYEAARVRFLALERSLNRNPDRKSVYMTEMSKYIDAGHVELVDSNDLQGDEAFYLPHHPVIKEGHESHALRIVFDGSATDHRGTSLNSSLLPGPALQTDLADVLLRFRSQAIGLTGDVSKMFLQIEIESSHRDWLRFLWREPGSNKPIR